MNKRIFIFVAIATLSAAFGAYLSLKKQDSAKFSSPAVALLMNANLPDAAGQTHSLSEWRGKVLLVNFWATWCPPCIEEMPLLDAFYQQNSANGWQVVGLAIDQPSRVRQFLSQHPVAYPVGQAGLNGTSLGTQLGNDQGGLPFTVVFDPQGGLKARKLGKLSEDDIKSWIL